MIREGMPSLRESQNTRTWVSSLAPSRILSAPGFLLYHARAVTSTMSLTAICEQSMSSEGSSALEAVRGIPHQRFQRTRKMRVCQDFDAARQWSRYPVL